LKQQQSILSLKEGSAGKACGVFQNHYLKVEKVQPFKIAFNNSVGQIQLKPGRRPEIFTA
jgi:hypothetical protein